MARRSRSQTDRDAESFEAYKARERARSRHDQVEDLAEAVGDDSGSESWDNIDTNVSQELHDSIMSDPRTRVLAVRIAHERKRRASDLLRVIGAKPPAERMSALEKTIRRMWALLIAIAIPAGSSTVLVVKYLTNKAATEERQLIERQALIDRVREHEERVKQLEAIATRNAIMIEQMQRERDRRGSRETARPLNVGEP